MCGLIYVRCTANTSAAPFIEKVYARQKSRGALGFGYVAIGKTCSVKRAETESQILKKLKQERASEILFHHRMPTSAPNYIDVTHPIRVEHDSLRSVYYLIHNGIIYNADTRKKAHEKSGFTYSTTVKIEHRTRNHTYTALEFNDSEALAIDLALYFEGKSESVKAQGSVAFICLQTERGTEKPSALYAARNSGSPLNVYDDGAVFALVSEGGGETMPTDTLFRYDYATGSTEQSAIRLPDIERLSLDSWSGYANEVVWDDSGDYSYYDGELEECREELRQIDIAIDIARNIGDREELETLLSDKDALTKRIREYEAMMFGMFGG